MLRYPIFESMEWFYTHLELFSSCCQFCSVGRALALGLKGPFMSRMQPQLQACSHHPHPDHMHLKGARESCPLLKSCLWTLAEWVQWHPLHLLVCDLGQQLTTLWLTLRHWKAGTHITTSSSQTYYGQCAIFINSAGILFLFAQEQFPSYSTQ